MKFLCVNNVETKSPELQNVKKVVGTKHFTKAESYRSSLKKNNCATYLVLLFL